MTYRVEFTKEYGVSSSLIDSVYFNENDRTVVLDVDDEYYRYFNVDAADVAALVDGDENGSVGGYYNKVFKKQFGPGTHLGHWDDAQEFQVSVSKFSPGTPKGLEVTDATTTTEYSLAEIKSEPVQSDATTEFSLAEIPAESHDVFGEDGVSTTVHFRLNGQDETYVYEASTSDVYGAVEELNRHVAKFGATGKVVKVVVQFED